MYVLRTGMLLIFTDILCIWQEKLASALSDSFYHHVQPTHMLPYLHVLSNIVCLGMDTAGCERLGRGLNHDTSKPVSSSSFLVLLSYLSIGVLSSPGYHLPALGPSFLPAPLSYRRHKCCLVSLAYTSLLEQTIVSVVNLEGTRCWLCALRYLLHRILSVGHVERPWRSPSCTV